MIGLLTHRDSVVPLVSLSALMGRPGQPDPAELAQSCVLLVSSGEGTIGLVVRALGAIERSVWEEREETMKDVVQAYDLLERALADRRTIRTAPVGSTGAERMLSRSDLAASATALAAGGWR